MFGLAVIFAYYIPLTLGPALAKGHLIPPWLAVWAPNMLTTGAMIRIGKTYGNLMVDVQTGSEKLKDRARRIVNIVTGLEYDEADKLLKRAHWNVKAAIVMQKTGLPYPKALSRLRKAHDSMREALGEDIEPRLRGMAAVVSRAERASGV